MNRVRKCVVFTTIVAILYLSVMVSFRTELEESCPSHSCRKSVRFLLYDVNPGEGFNLRCDVFICAALFVRGLNELYDGSVWTLVLPPWAHMQHWNRTDVQQQKLHWSLFFDVDSINTFVPVMEFDEYLSERNDPVIERVFYLTSPFAEEMDANNNWTLTEMECADVVRLPYALESSDAVRGWFWDYKGIYTRKLDCYKADGTVDQILPRLLVKADVSDKAVMIDRLENLAENNYGTANYWKARRSMRFSQHLLELGNTFRAQYLNSTDELDGTQLSENWEMQKVSAKATGGSYVCAHVRRGDFLWARSVYIPTIAEAASQLQTILREQNLSSVFLATDGTPDEVNELKESLPGTAVWTYNPSAELLHNIKEGGTAIVEQWICAHARIFIGSYASTFSFRIQEEREILGFDSDTSFNRFCGTSGDLCEQPTKWPIVYES